MYSSLYKRHTKIDGSQDKKYIYHHRKDAEIDGLQYKTYIQSA